jgi:hypothetical protein
VTAEAVSAAIGDLFERRPVQFGLRGDPHLWQALQSEFAETALPEDWFELRRLLQEAIERRIGQALNEFADPASVYIPEFDPGHGMSAGQVHLPWWVHTGIPIVLDRFEGLRGTPDPAEL